MPTGQIIGFGLWQATLIVMSAMTATANFFLRLLTISILPAVIT